MSVHRQRLKQMLQFPLDRLVVATNQVLPESGQVERWSLSADDRAALVRWGLPVVDDTCLSGDVQAGTAPAMTIRGRQMYGLGLLSALEIGADPMTGAVWGFSSVDGSPDSFVNSSVTKFIESAWRWHWAWQEIKQLRHSFEQFDLLDDFLAFVVELDAKVDQAEVSFWREYIESW